MSSVSITKGSSGYPPCHGKKSDKETQSLMLKIFKDIMQKEKQDPEKTNLLQSKKEDKKRKFLGTRNKNERKSRESSSSDQRKRHNPYNSSANEQRTAFDHRSQSIGNKRDSWLFWEENENENKKAKKTEDSFSCVSCALKKIVSSEYACVGCLLVLLTISIVVAFLVVCKNVPTLVSSENNPNADTTLDSERLKRKIEMIKANTFRNGMDIANQENGFGDKNHWKENSAMQADGLSGIAGAEFGPTFRELDSIADLDSSRFTGNLNNILDETQISEIQNSERLRDFYRKLMATDVQIRNLKESLDNGNDNYMQPLNRIRRSLKLHTPKKKPKDPKERNKFKENKKLYKTDMIAKMKIKGVHRNKRNGGEPVGFVIEKKKVLVHYKPKIKKVPKCSHAPKDSNTHEKQLKHPFYKNTQRLDELLDVFLSKKIPEIMSDPFGLDQIFNVERNISKSSDKVREKESKTVNPHNDLIKSRDRNHENNIWNILKQESSTFAHKHSHQGDSRLLEDKTNKLKTTTTESYDYLISISTVMNTEMNSYPKIPTLSPLKLAPNIRRLMQVENDDDDNLGYEDLKEVLTDDIEGHDDADGSSKDRKKRMEGSNSIEEQKFQKPVNINNPNWKGPMPLYPDELNTMFKQASMHSNKAESDRTERYLNDIEYVEDYLNNKYDKLVKMAQAYSDYGVLDGKKTERNEKSSANGKMEHKIKLSIDKGIFKRGLIQRKKKHPHEKDSNEMVTSTVQSCSENIPSEGIRIEIRPTTKAQEDIFDISNIMPSHLKIIHESNEPNNNYNELSTYPSVGMVFTQMDVDENDTFDYENTTTAKQIEDSVESNFILSMAKMKRSLLSVKLEDQNNNFDDFEVANTTKIHDNVNNTSTPKIITLHKSLHNNSTEYSSTLPYSINVDNFVNYIKSSGNRTNNSLGENQVGIKNELNDFDKEKLFENVHSTAGYKPATIDNNANRTLKTLVDLSTRSSPNYLKSNSHTSIMGSNRNIKVFIISDDDEESADDYLDTLTLPLVLYFNDYANGNNSDKIDLILSNDKQTKEFTQLTNSSFNKRHTLKTDDYIDKNPKLLDLENTTNSGSRKIKTNNTDLINKSSVNENIEEVKTNYSSLSNQKIISNNTEAPMSLSDFFSMMSNWFWILEGISFREPSNNSGSNVEVLTKDKKKNKNLTDFSYPLYDSEMIENIGHRSRVLLSVENSDNVTVKSDTKVSSEVKSTHSENNISYTTKSNFTQENDVNVIKNTKEGDIKANKTIVKRNADDSNLIFWNDIYDDEYGVDAERSDNPVRDKLSVNENGLIKKSGLWVQEKIKKLVQNMKKPTEASTASIARISRDINNPGMQKYSQYVYDRISNKIRKRQADNPEENDGGSNQKFLFEAMTKNMKEVCKKAAQAVEQTRNIEVREDSKQESIATTLMQQLVRLMNDLVDYQVKQKTCSKLPSDLQNFLEWLTSPEDATDSSHTVTFKSPYQDDIIHGLNMDIYDDKPPDQSFVSTENTQVDSKIQYIGALNNVQDLMHRYEAMTDEDKSKMTGVKKYLEDQINYLNKRISRISDNIYASNTGSIRFRRDLTPHKQNRRIKRKLRKYIKNFGKKHTRTTASNYDVIRETDLTEKSDRFKIDETKGINIGADKEIIEPSNTVKRNLKDVYYKAIEDAKRYTTLDVNIQTKLTKTDNVFDENEGNRQN